MVTGGKSAIGTYGGHSWGASGLKYSWLQCCVNCVGGMVEGVGAAVVTNFQNSRGLYLSMSGSLAE